MSDSDVQTDAAPLDEDKVDALEPDDEGYNDVVVVDDEVHKYTPSEAPPRPAQPNRGPHKSSTQISKEVWAGKWGEDGWQERVKSAGYDLNMVELLVSRGIGRPDNVDSTEPGRHAEL